MESGGAEPLVLNLDLSKQAAADTVVAHGKIDALLNIAGTVPQIDLFEMTDELTGSSLRIDGGEVTSI